MDLWLRRHVIGFFKLRSIFLKIVSHPCEKQHKKSDLERYSTVSVDSRQLFGQPSRPRFDNDVRINFKNQITIQNILQRFIENLVLTILFRVTNN